ncbi:MAG: WG repeat-containing protein [Saprospiraceae bacterium]|nr:WG repeat-containing protein [Saprospiraceae bacterium]
MKTSFNNIIFVISILLVFLISCETNSKKPKIHGDLDNSNNISSIDNRLVCFQIGQNNFDEFLTLQISNNKISGEGIRVYANTQKTYKLFLDGKFNGKESEITIQGSNTRKPEDSFINTESWIIGKNQLLINNRNSKGIKGSYKFYRVKCSGSKENDSTLYDSFNGFFEGYAVVSKDGYYGLINEEWEITIPLKYKDLGVVNEGSIVFYDQFSGLSGLLDVHGNIILDAKYSEIHCFNEGLAAFLNNEGKWGFINKSLKVVIEPQYLNINFFKPDPRRHPFNEGLANVQTSNNKWNYINNKGMMVITGNFLFAKSFVNGKAEVFKDNRWYTIDKTGKCIDNCD